MKSTYLRSGDFDFHRRKCFPNAKIAKVKRLINPIFKNIRKILIFFEKNLQYNIIYISTVWRFYFSPAKVISKLEHFESENG